MEETSIIRGFLLYCSWQESKSKYASQYIGIRMPATAYLSNEQTNKGLIPQKRLTELTALVDPDFVHPHEHQPYM